MVNNIVYSAVFIRKAKIYKKKYHSLVEDLYELESKLLGNPEQGMIWVEDFLKFDLQ